MSNKTDPAERQAVAFERVAEQLERLNNGVDAQARKLDTIQAEAKARMGVMQAEAKARAADAMTMAHVGQRPAADPLNQLAQELDVLRTRVAELERERQSRPS